MPAVVVAVVWVAGEADVGAWLGDPVVTVIVAASVKVMGSGVGCTGAMVMWLRQRRISSSFPWEERDSAWSTVSAVWRAAMVVCWACRLRSVVAL